MSHCPPIQRCKVCDELLIHRGKRSMYESASYLGQIVFNLLPHEFTWIDIDGALYRRSIRLLRFFEHKSPGQHRKQAQRELLELLSRMIEHIKNCPDAKGHFFLHERSGAYLIEGDPHEGNQLGPSTITRLYDGKSQLVEDELEILCWIPLLEDEQSRNKVQDKLSKRRSNK